jgi:hypothetical protein
MVIAKTQAAEFPFANRAASCLARRGGSDAYQTQHAAIKTR